MTAIDWLLVSATLGFALVHLFYGIRYRKFFVVDKATMDKTYWSMIVEFKKHHPKAGSVLVAVVWLQIPIVAALAIRRAFT